MEFGILLETNAVDSTIKTPKSRRRNSNSPATTNAVVHRQSGEFSRADSYENFDRAEGNNFKLIFLIKSTKKNFFFKT